MGQVLPLIKVSIRIVFISSSPAASAFGLLHSKYNCVQEFKFALELRCRSCSSGSFVATPAFRGFAKPCAGGSSNLRVITVMMNLRDLVLAVVAT